MIFGAFDWQKRQKQHETKGFDLETHGAQLVEVKRIFSSTMSGTRWWYAYLIFTCEIFYISQKTSAYTPRHGFVVCLYWKRPLMDCCSVDAARRRWRTRTARRHETVLPSQRSRVLAGYQTSRSVCRHQTRHYGRCLRRALPGSSPIVDVVDATAASASLVALQSLSLERPGVPSAGAAEVAAVAEVVD